MNRLLLASQTQMVSEANAVAQREKSQTTFRARRFFSTEIFMRRLYQGTTAACATDQITERLSRDTMREVCNPHMDNLQSVANRTPPVVLSDPVWRHAMPDGYLESAAQLRKLAASVRDAEARKRIISVAEEFEAMTAGPRKAASRGRSTKQSLLKGARQSAVSERQPH